MIHGRLFNRSVGVSGTHQKARSTLNCFGSKIRICAYQAHLTAMYALVKVVMLHKHLVSQTGVDVFVSPTLRNVYTSRRL